jgi:hypothetical protein
MLGRHDFMKSAFLAANGCDIQPFLRYTPLLEPVDYDGQKAFVFVSATIGTPETLEEAEELFRERIARLDGFFPGALRMVGQPRPIPIEFFDYARLPAPPELQAFVSSGEHRAMVAKHGAKPWGAEFTFQRGSGGPLIKLLHIAGEAAASLWMLSHGGKYPPKLLSTVQAGDELQGPGQVLEKLLEISPQRPEYWVKGLWRPNRDRDPDDLRGCEKYRRAWFDLRKGAWRHVVQRYPQWNSQFGLTEDMHAECCADPSHAIVMAVTKQQPEPLPLVTELKSRDGRRVVRLIGAPLAMEDDAVYVMSRRLKARCKALPSTARVFCWEELFGQRAGDPSLPVCTLAEALQALTRLRAAHVRITPVGFEDEGFSIRRFLEDTAGPAIRVDIHLRDQADFIDLRRGS